MGALITNPASSSAAANFGRLSGSMDEFRYWKNSRTPKEIGTYWFDQVRGGANSDISNADLGVYYKFNEGITGNSATDSVVLDYAGRATNGVWVGYRSDSRNTGSAIVSASAASKEREDPIMRTDHADIINLKAELFQSGTSYDYNNNSSIISMVPGWLQDLEAEKDDSDLRYIAHVMGAYFDKIKLQIQELPKLKQASYPSASFKPYPLKEHLPQSLGLYTPELFVDSTIIEKFLNRNEDSKFEGSLEETKNLIYQNLYNNLAHIYKSKGTERSIRNALRCFNIDDKVLSLQIKSDNEEYELRNNLRQHVLNKKFINFNTTNNSKAVIYNRSASLAEISDSKLVTGSIFGTPYHDSYGITYEANFLFPKFTNEYTEFVRDDNYNKISLFGFLHVDAASDAQKRGTNLSPPADDIGTLKISAVRDKVASKNVYFELSSSFTTGSNNFTLTSSVFFDVYDDELWNLSVRLRPTKFEPRYVTGSSRRSYEVVFSGYNPQAPGTYNSFQVVQEITSSIADNIFSVPKRPYVGADRTNLTGDVNYRTDVYAGSVTYWTKYIEQRRLNSVHANSPFNMGASGSYLGQSPLWLSGNTVEMLGRNTLALNWAFDDVSTSDSGGNFIVTDFSSGSSTLRDFYGWPGKLAGYQHTGYGSSFKASSSDVVDRRQINAFEFIDPEQAASSEMINILDQDDDVFAPAQTNPNFLFTLEKSMYATISSEEC